MVEITAPSKGKRGACDACGDTPVMHFPTYWGQTFEVWLIDKTERAEHSFLGSLQNAFEPFIDVLIKGIVRTALFLRIFRVSHEVERACSYRSQVVWEEAQRRGIPMEQIKVFGIYTELFRAKMHGRWIYFQSLPIPTHMAKRTYRSIDDKLRLKQFLTERGIPMTAAAHTVSIAEARAIFDALQKPVVVKPRLGSRARHTTTNIHTLAELETAFMSAQMLCRHVLIEEHLEGAVSRATAVDGQLTGFLQMFPARVIGDGVHTIAELVVVKNENRPERVQAITFDNEHIAYLARSGYAINSIPARSERVVLSRRTGRFEGGATREMPSLVHPKLRAYIERAAQELRVPVVGFDIIIPDPEADPDSQRWGILEANSLPYIDLHYAPLDGEPSNVAGAVWDLWDAEKAEQNISMHTESSTAPAGRV